MGELSERQRKILQFVREYIASEGYAPSMQDILDGLAIRSTSVVSYNLWKLEQRGYIAITPNIARSIRVLGA